MTPCRFGLRMDNIPITRLGTNLVFAKKEYMFNI